ncbi:hypothetical protein HW561_20515 [Rhodobacteraceae bacterium B1Z28]|uniref:Metal-binding protein n=1 Tax=Ruegeria haliotis TaxID=2747601 RepID=A0ABX2PVH4_9RHOB|nr:hypothetical protein [Ruegeria haliotis]NVO58180.1 hypothetical protein [Ruegeria haliotis]
MIWKTKTHEYAATVCQRTGKTCPALARMARTIAQAMAEAGPVSAANFEIEGSSELTHCPKGCSARFRAHCDRIRVFCGTDPDDAINSLDDYADMIFDSDFSTLPAGVISNPPCAMLEVSTLTPRKVTQEPLRISA